jgi:energy-coupling factor transport system ATP-binding protein
MNIVEFNNSNILSHEQVILNNISLSIAERDFVIFSGISGSGKTTLINEIVKNYSGVVGRVFQDANQQFTMETPYMELVFLLENLQVPANEIDKKIDNILNEFHLIDLKNHKVNTELSGGEQQRLALAEALLIDSKLIILDEPFASVDVINREFLLNKIGEISKTKTIIIADHNPSIYEKLANRIIHFSDNKIDEIPKSKFVEFYNQFKLVAHFKSTAVGDSLIKAENFSVDNLFSVNSLKIPKLSKTLIIGENGTGKTSFFNTLLKLKNYQGTIKNKAIKTVPAFQHAEDSFLEITVGDEISFATKHQFSPIDVDVDYWLRNLNLENKNDQSVYTLSGGEKKKLQILTIVIQNPDLLLLDEPFAGLDINSIKEVVSLLKTNPQQTQIIISHEFHNLEKYINNIIEIKDQKLQNIGEVIFK